MPMLILTTAPAWPPLKMLATYHTPSSPSTKRDPAQEPLILEFWLFQSLRVSCFGPFGRTLSVVLSTRLSLDLCFNHPDSNGGCPFNRLPSPYLDIDIAWFILILSHSDGLFWIGIRRPRDHLVRNAKKNIEFEKLPCQDCCMSEPSSSSSSTPFVFDN